MHYLIIYTHPNPVSFNHAIRETIAAELRKNNRKFQVRDLYGIGFHPVLSPGDFAEMQAGSVQEDVRTEQDALRSADFIICIFPLWWAGMPAMLKGYIDRVFTEGFAYRFSEAGIEGLLNGKKVFLFTTTGASREDYEAGGFFRSIGQTIDSGIFGLCGMELVGHHYFTSVPTVTDDERKRMLEELKTIIREKIL